MTRICSQIGGFGNHVRWLILLDKQHQFIIQVNDFRLEFRTQQEKYNAFVKNIYPLERTWSNWLEFEWMFRNELDKHILFTHFISNFEDKIKTLVLTTDPGVALRSYFKFNPTLNYMPVDRFVNDAEEFRNYYKTMQDSEYVRILKTEILWQPILDRSVYSKIIKWFGLDDNYELASQVHGLWYEAHKRAEKEFLTCIPAVYFSRK